MSKSHPPTRLHGFRSFVFGILCVLLVAFSATIQVAHAHEAAGPSHSDCALCLIAHAGIAPHAPAVVTAAIEHSAKVEILRSETPRDSFVSCFYIRPPPAETASL